MLVVHDHPTTIGLTALAARSHSEIMKFRRKELSDDQFYEAMDSQDDLGLVMRDHIHIEHWVEQFLVERYQLYSRALGPALWRGPVRHEPWRLFAARVSDLDEDLSAAAGLRPLGQPDFCHWSPGVQVAFEHFRLA